MTAEGGWEGAGNPRRPSVDGRSSKASKSRGRSRSGLSNPDMLP